MEIHFHLTVPVVQQKEARHNSLYGRSLQYLSAPQQEEINTALLRDGLRPAARQFQVSTGSLGRHRQHIRGQFALT